MSVYRTGAMPPPPATELTFEAGQAPLMYVLTGWLFRALDLIGIEPMDSFNRFMPVILFLASLGWTTLFVVFIERALRLAPSLLKALTLSTVMMLPVTVEMSAMYDNDLPVNILATAALLTVWSMLRSGRTLDQARWLRAATLIGLAIFFKNNGMILIPIYAAIAAYLALYYGRSSSGSFSLRKLSSVAAVGLPLMLIPASIEIWNTSRYTGGDLAGMPLMMPVRSMFGRTPVTFFTTFDLSVLNTPFATGRLADSAGKDSFWSIQYVTLHSDYLNHWNSPAYQSWPTSSLMDLHRRYPIPISQFVSAVILAVLAIPVTMIMIVGFSISLYRVFRRFRFASRDGSILIVVMTICAEAAQVVYYAN